MKAMINFMKTMLALPKGWVAWIGALLLVNFAGALLFIGTVEGQIVLGGIMVGAMTQAAIFSRLGFVRLLGIGHVLWVPMIFWLLSRVDPFAPSGLFESWIVAVVVLDTLSLLIDGTDVMRYVLGDREPQLSIEAPPRARA